VSAITTQATGSVTRTSVPISATSAECSDIAQATA
jgi:hypothetical protein